MKRSGPIKNFTLQAADVQLHVGFEIFMNIKLLILRKAYNFHVCSVLVDLCLIKLLTGLYFCIFDLVCFFSHSQFKAEICGEIWTRPFSLNISSWRCILRWKQTRGSLWERCPRVYFCLDSRTNFTVLYLSYECGRLPLILLWFHPHNSKVSLSTSQENAHTHTHKKREEEKRGQDVKWTTWTITWEINKRGR